MPSSPPDVWRADIEATRKRLSPAQVLSVSVVATPEPNWGLEQIAADYAQCARWACESGADCVELNFSCPNVQSIDGQLYLSPEAAQRVAGQVKQAIGQVPLIVKIGHVPEAKRAAALLAAIGSIVDGLSMTNCISAQVQRDDQPMFGGEWRGIGGAAIRQSSVTQIGLFAKLISDQQLAIQLIGVGGVFTAEHANQYLQAGAAAVHLATAPMLDPLVGRRIKDELAASSTRVPLR
jgi:dihydroorotate dehydrogenase